jgi:hypothetical protein
MRGSTVFFLGDTVLRYSEDAFQIGGLESQRFFWPLAAASVAGSNPWIGSLAVDEALRAYTNSRSAIPPGQAAVIMAPCLVAAGAALA